MVYTIEVGLQGKVVSTDRLGPLELHLAPLFQIIPLQPFRDLLSSSPAFWNSDILSRVFVWLGPFQLS